MLWKQWFRNIWNSFAVQLLLLHFKKHQLVLIYWVILFATITGNFMQLFGAKSLFLAPEYLDTVNGIGAFMVGFAIGVFIMAWNITTFILFSRHIKFLATTDKPFLRYCLNNFLIPLCFLVVYYIKIYQYGTKVELFSAAQLFEIYVGLTIGLILNFIIGFIYFFTADKTIAKKIAPVLEAGHMVDDTNINMTEATTESKLINVKTYLIGLRKSGRVRDVRHYNKHYIEAVFSRHHLASVLLIVIAFLFLLFISFFQDYKVMQLPAAASITVFFTILLSLFGALAYFLQNWSLPVTIIVFLIVNYLYTKKIIDPTNKAYGLDYSTTHNRPAYSAETLQALCTKEKVSADTQHMIGILNKWKAKQRDTLPTMYIINVSGGGTRSATFAMHVLRKLDSQMNGELLRKTILISGASGGMLGAAYYRELYWQQQQGKIKDKNNPIYVDDIGKDLLNPIFSSLTVRDVLSPAQRFEYSGQKYLKDRGYAFEQRLNTNTRGLLSKPISSYKHLEENAEIPLLFFNSVVIRDAKKMVISTQPVSFMMRPMNSELPDAIDFGAMFAQQNALNLNVLTALRMNATFPVVLPTVWLPTRPIIDVMDAGVRDNYGTETSIRFISTFENWLSKNVKKVVVISIRDRVLGGWDMPFENNSMVGAAAKPVAQLQYNIFKFQDYVQADQWQYLQKHSTVPLQKVDFIYAPTYEEDKAALNFHLTNREKKNIEKEIMSPANKQSFASLVE